MATLRIKPDPIRFFLRIFILAFVGLLAPFAFWHIGSGNWQFLLEEYLLILRGRTIEALIATGVVFLFTIKPICSGALDIQLTDDSLMVPTQKFGLWGDVITARLSGLTVSRTFQDRLNHAQIVTDEGVALRIHPIFYEPKTLPRLMDEIERRQAQLKG